MCALLALHYKEEAKGRGLSRHNGTYDPPRAAFALMISIQKDNKRVVS